MICIECDEEITYEEQKLAHWAHVPGCPEFDEEYDGCCRCDAFAHRSCCRPCALAELVLEPT